MSDLRIILVPRFGTTAGDDWYGWLEKKLRARKKFPLGEWVFCDLQPKPDAPTLAACNKHLGKLLGDDPAALADTLVIGHSLGAQIALRTLAAMKGDAKVRGLLCAAGWLALDHPPRTLSEWIETRMDEKAAAAHAGAIVNVISTNDPNQMNADATAKVWRDGALGADVVFSSTPGHVSGREEPEVLDAVLKHFG
ncbi:MAG: alpha/beta hydrolase [Proteobacteria bacterium]|nr:alpha/beta hydrolase [Pseudomonadota bacterium]MDA1132441.1 alpha/beta hydrolase [Pseudomonadota bacterium]